MDKKRMRMFATLAALAVIPLYGTYAAADEDRDARRDEDNPVRRVKVLEGKYGFTTQQVCMRTLPNPPGVQQVDPTTLKLLVPGEIVSMAGLGTMNFHANGTLDETEATANALEYNMINPGDTPLQGQLNPVCNGDWHIDSGNRVTVNWNCVVSTPNPAVKIIAGPVNWEGFVSDGGRTIDLNLKGTLQTLTTEVNGVPVQAVNRLCEQRFVLRKVPD